MWKFIVSVILAAAAVLAGVVILNRAHNDQPVSADAVLLPSVDVSLSGYQRAVGPYDWHFPADYGSHPDFQTEWWYYTGNLVSDSGRRFGFEFTIFRRAILPDAPDSASEWRTNQVYMAHFTVTDVANGRFYQDQRFSRGAAGLAGAEGQPIYHVWLDDWDVRALNVDAVQTAITAASEEFSIDLTLDQVKDPVLQGDHGFSPKGNGTGNATYYYSLPRLTTQGDIVVGGQSYSVTGTTWMDHEFGTGAMSADAQGWDWFGLHLDDGRDLMVGLIRRTGGSDDLVYGGVLVMPDGSTRKLSGQDFTIEVTDTWTSPDTQATYPAAWTITINTGDAQPLILFVQPLVADQELTEGIVYWEGAVHITGDATGYGYVELTGYKTPMRERF